MVNTVTFDEFVLETGTVLRAVPVAYQTWGQLNPRRDNVIVVCHALTGSADVESWWGPMIGPGRALDTDRFFVVSANVIGSPYGSVSPLTVNPDTGAPYGAAFPEVTIRDTVRLHKMLLDELGITQVAMVIGGSMGGMQVLEWAFFGDYVKSLVPIAVGGKHSAWCIGWSEAQRQAIYADPNWKGGNYTPDAAPDAGLAAARMMAMISYRSRASFEDRFGRELMPRTNGTTPAFRVESYLRHQGEKLVQRFDANCYVSLTKQMDTHDVSRGRGTYENVLRCIGQPTLVIGISSDVLYPVEEQEELARFIPNAHLEIIDAPHGHDSFLIEIEYLQRIVQQWMESKLMNVPGIADVCI